MSYATHGDLKKRMKRVYDEIYYDPETEAVNDDLADDDLAAAAAEIDGRLSKIYVVPVTSAESLPLMKSWNLILAEELAYSRADAPALPDNVKARCENVRKQLADVVKGEGGLIAEAAQNTGFEGALIVSKADPVFTREKMEGF